MSQVRYSVVTQMYFPICYPSLSLSSFSSSSSFLLSPPLFLSLFPLPTPLLPPFSNLVLQLLRIPTHSDQKPFYSLGLPWYYLYLGALLSLSVKGRWWATTFPFISLFFLASLKNSRNTLRSLYSIQFTYDTLTQCATYSSIYYTRHLNNLRKIFSFYAEVQKLKSCLRALVEDLIYCIGSGIKHIFWTNM